MEKRAREAADAFVHLSGTLQTNLKAVTSILDQYEKLYAAGALEVSGAADEAVSSVQDLIKKVGVLDAEMSKVYDVQQEVAAIKTLLDDLEQRFLPPPESTS